ncbi:arylesterase [Aquabacter cavernae]|uniref:arylesterase n=1 Tax=Aquabacter cavernae TaxID=2496029 RepID=UPI000F8CDE7F|nr:arylesterase [Aquabacter cavernae]
MCCKALVLALTVVTILSSAVQAAPLKVVALGDSLTAGLGLSRADSFAAKLEAALKAKGYDVTIVNAGVSGDTTGAGLARLDWSVPQHTDAVIVELGANDMLRGLSPDIARGNLTEILTRLKARHIPVLLTGMRAAPNLGADYRRSFDAIYPDLAAKFEVPLYPFFLEGVAGDRVLNQKDGIHPTAEGVDRIVAAILPSAEALVRDAQARKAKAPAAQ